MTSVAPQLDELERLQQAAVNEIARSFKGFRAKVIRDYVRSVLVPPGLMRLYRIGMGVEKFEVPTEAGNVITVPAFASVQVTALKAVIELGMPRQLGLVDSDGADLPGVVVLGPLELDELQQVQSSERFPQLKRLGNGNGDRSNGDAMPSPAEPSNPEIPDTSGVMLSPSVRAGGYEIVEVEQDAMAPIDGQRPGEAPPPPLKSEPTLAQQILARRRAQRQSRPSSADETP